MLMNAVRRCGATFVSRPLDAFVANLAGFGIFGGCAVLLLFFGKGLWWTLFGAALVLWIGVAWYCAVARKLIDGQTVGLAWTVPWLREKGSLLTADFFVFLALLAWAALALKFWRANPIGLSPSFAWGALALVGAVLVWLSLALMLLPILATESDARFFRDLRRAALLPLAFLPQALGAALILILGSGCLGLLVGTGNWMARILGLPLVMAPMITPIALALFAIALFDEMKARSLNRPSPGQDAPSAVSLVFPWR